ncbi:rhodanese-like domain-containing protein [Isoptericola sp. NPDC019571]|uniref:rhodanese-like domain-containing protein n=1 Tax=Isoptericola sp. NPDC019571 TaxID=3364008 RepID=UPI0037967D7B
MTTSETAPDTAPETTSETVPGTAPGGTGPTTPPTQDARTAGARVADGALLVDVRSARGRAATGDIPGATLADRDDLDALFGPADAPAISLDTPVVVVCGSIDGSGPVAAALTARGFTDVTHVDGGFPAWRDAGLPATAPSDGPAAGA